MEQRKELIRKYVSIGMSVTKASSIAGLCRSTYYHRPTGKKRGKKPTSFTLKHSSQVPDSEVVSRIESILSEDEFIDYGYYRTAMALKKEGYKINHKKVYRLMKERKLLFPPLKPGRLAKRGFVKYTTPLYVHPFATIEMDIKYVYIHQEKKFAFLLTLIDTFTRFAPEWILEYSVKYKQVLELLKKASNNPFIEPFTKSVKVMIRTDNGSQFITKDLADHLENLPFRMEFIHPGTPQENGHIESFHNTLNKLVISKFEFSYIDHARSVLEDFFSVYNYKRIMKAILYCTPDEFLRKWQNGEIGIKTKNRKQIFFFRETQPDNPAVLSSEAFLNWGLTKVIH